jgi:hypothetical protein
MVSLKPAMTGRVAGRCRNPEQLRPNLDNFAATAQLTEMEVKDCVNNRLEGNGLENIKAMVEDTPAEVFGSEQHL